jgi:hypothetical protein
MDQAVTYLNKSCTCCYLPEKGLEMLLFNWEWHDMLLFAWKKGWA